ncbi:MAG: glycosyltransferase family 2 protein [Spiribacter salinus]|uniref:Glycosyltransferase family 2 protein n=1 Tax=Spiribacter salinus TaxID=1335746 RepID=A0A540VVE0_9GAMM|nr:MAG: glycosyltransferase family 2 protein [Spiribacter salinus]
MLSVIFATHNGQKTLPEMFECFAHVYQPPGGWQIIAVDNASTDRTSEILSVWREKLPMTVLECFTPGKNHALNHAIESASGDLFVFTDDDIRPDRRWLVKLWEAARDAKQADVFAGKILPKWPFQPPEWFLESVPLGVVYSITPRDIKEGFIPSNRVWGPNMAVRRSVFEKGWRFDGRVGPGPGQYLMGSETELTGRLSAAGYRCWYQPRAIVEHIIDAKQMDLNWIVARGYRAGKGAAMVGAEGTKEESTERVQRTALGVPLWRVRIFAERWSKAKFSWLLGRERDWFEAAYSAKYQAGYIVQKIKSRGTR